MAASPDEIADVRGGFARMAADHPELPLYAAICAAVADDDETASLLLAARPGQRRPVLWLAALHDLVLRRPDLPAARWFASVVGPDAVPVGDPWPDIRRTVLDHREELAHVITTRSTQTNEVNRCVYVAAALGRVCADLPERPVVLVELGASAGLLLGVDHYRVELTSDSDDVVTVLGDPASTVVCAGTDRSRRRPPVGPLPRIVGRVGLDLDPVDLRDPEAVRWLEACLWPDVAGRVERFRAAVAVTVATSPTLRRGDMVDDLGDVIRSAVAGADSPDVHVVVLSSWALTYVAKERRPQVAVVLSDAARGGMPVSWLTAEPPGCMPGLRLPPALADRTSGTVLGARTWRAGHETEPGVLGTCHEHGQWIDLA
ncbi:MAG: DUF2332 domain-containing protein [Terracoccus sp.]